MAKADWIKLFAVITAGPRWIVALLAAEGLHLPPSWADWWIIASALSALGMAVVEGLAFAYVFQAWRTTTNEGQARVLGVMAVVSAGLFVAMLTPSIAASVRGVRVSEMLTDIWLYLWAASVALSTIAIVASVGYAERTTKPATRPNSAPPVQVTTPPAPTLDAPENAPQLPAGDKRARALALRAAKPNMSQTAIAIAVGVKPSTVSRWFRKQNST